MSWNPQLLHHKRRPCRNLEHEEQCKVIYWARLHRHRWPCLKWFHASLSGVPLTRGQAGRAKAAGMESGISDLFLPYRSGVYPGLYIEMKRPKGGRTSDDQKEFIDFVLEQGYRATVANGAPEAIKILQDYLMRGM